MGLQTGVLIGSGGMGEVYRAWDPELQRPVALKYLRSSDPELIERLKREARAQARVDHPAVCQVYEVGDDGGRPYIAMQYVDGRQLDQAADAMTLEQKVFVVREVAEAVQAAHAVGLIHRDLKPANILVSEGGDGEPRPYVLDFGIAREQDVAGLTMTGQVVGTPGYLSPEQARGETTTIDRRTDVFSLGVILYELLSGRRPFDGDSQVEVLMALLEQDPIPLRQLGPTIPRDLETVVMSCLEKDRDRRYSSARELAEDLGRFLAGEPVSARPVGRTVRLIRKARRHPFAATAVVTAVVAVLALVTVAVGGWIKYTVDLKRERNAALEASTLAEGRAAEARDIADFMLGVFEVSNPNESDGDVVTARELLDQGAERIERDLVDRPAVQARLLGVMGEAYARLGLFDAAGPLLKRAFEQLQALPEATIDARLEARVRWADLLMNRADYDGAAEVLSPVPELVADTEAVDPAVAVQSLGSFGRVLMYQGNWVQAESVMSQAIARAEQDFGVESALVGDLLSDRSVIYTDQKHWDLAIADAQRALDLREHHYGSDDPRVSTTLNNLALAFQGAGRLEDAAVIGERVLALRERQLGPEHPRTSTAMNNLGLIYKKLGQLDRAEELYLGSLAIRIRLLGEADPRVATVLNNLAGVYRDRGDLDQAAATYRRALAIGEAALGPDHPNLCTEISGLVLISMTRGDYAEAERMGLRDLRIRELAYGPDSPNYVSSLRTLAANQIALGKLTEAEANLTRARRIAVAAWGEDNDRVAWIDQVQVDLDRARSEGIAAQGVPGLEVVGEDRRPAGH